MITIREAQAEDFETIRMLNKKLGEKEHGDFDPTINPDFAATERGARYFKESIERDDRLVLLAEEHGAPIGYAAGGIERVGPYRTISSMCEVYNMWVEEAYRSRGVGKRLMNKFEEWALKRGTARMRVIASYENKAAIKFYTREGFREYDLILEKDL